jgi:hypothetical protein
MLLELQKAKKGLWKLCEAKKASWKPSAAIQETIRIDDDDGDGDGDGDDDDDNDECFGSIVACIMKKFLEHISLIA